MTEDRSPYSLKDALMGGPGLDGYAFNADTYCVDCGRDIIRKVWPAGGLGWPEFQDSETLPQPIFFGESDGPQHCADCGEYLYGPQDQDREDS